MKLWDKGYTVNNLVERFTIGNDRQLDLKLAIYDVLGNAAHARMLHHIGILSETELKDILHGLDLIQLDIENGRFIIEETFEDVHSKIEFELVRLIGEAGKKIHTARSRNDQVLTDLHLYVKAEISHIRKLVKTLFDVLQELSEQHKAILIPGYTHLQVAMPSSFGLWFGAYAEALIDDVILLNAAWKISDQNPLGSAAGYGSSFPIDRSMTTKLLHFGTMKYNVVAAQMSRGKLEKSFAFALSSLAGTLSRLSSDICLFMNQNFNFVGFPKELTTGSSIMPHKQNPDVFEIMRSRSNKVQNLPNEIILMTNNLTSGYHRDFQLLKESLMNAVEITKDNIEVATFMLQHIQVNEHAADNSIYDYMYSVETVNKKVLEGQSFRDAYRELGEAIIAGKYEPDKQVQHTHEGSIGNLCTEHIRQKMNDVLKGEDTLRN